MRIAHLAVALALAVQLPVGHAQVAATPQTAAFTEVAGVRYPNAVGVGGSTLQLNGAGIRYKAIFKVYTAGLYLSHRADSPEAVLAASGPKRLQVVMLRAINANELGKLFIRGIQENASRAEFAQSIPGTIRMGEIFASKNKLEAGESFSVDWLPDSGTVVRVNGKQVGEPIKEPEFFHGLMRIWLGQKPADHQLKDLLLGKQPPAAVDNGQVG
jgi:hypothetical protein